MDIAKKILTTFNDDFLKKVITGDESWVYSHDSESPIIAMEPSRRVKTEKSTSSSGKFEGFAQCFLGLQWCGYHEFLPQGRKVNKEYYLEVMRRLHETILTT